MSVVANTQNTYNLTGIREDLSDMIYNISPTETPFMSSIGRGKAKQVLHEWQTDALAAQDTANAQLEGDDITTFAAAAATSRVGNYCQISRKLAIVGGTAEQVNKAGRDSEMAYQLAKRSAELKRDMESIFLTLQGAVAGNTTTARKLGALLAQIKTNTDKGASGVDPVWTTVPSTARTDGTARAFTETILKNVIQKVWSAGGTPKILMVDATQKQTVSSFAGIATKTYYQSAVKTSVIVGAADVYVSDFGTLSVVPNRFQRHADGWVLDNEYISVDYLRPFQTIPLAKTGDAEKRMIIVEYTLRLGNEAAEGLCADLT